MSRNAYYFLYGIVIGTILGILVSDETKKKWQEKIKNKAKSFPDGSYFKKLMIQVHPEESCE